MIIGYTRKGAEDENIDIQLSALREAGCDKIYIEDKGQTEQQTEFDTLLNFLQEGDSLVIFKLDRIGKSLHDLLHYIELFAQRNITFISLHENIDTSTPQGKEFYHMANILIEYEFSVKQERTLAGLEAAKGRGVKLGRRKGVGEEALAKAEYALKLYKEYDYGVREIAQKLNITPATFYRYIRMLNQTPNRVQGRKKNNHG